MRGIQGLLNVVQEGDENFGLPLPLVIDSTSGIMKEDGFVGIASHSSYPFGTRFLQEIS